MYQTNLDEGVAGYSDTLLSIVANFTNSGKPEGYNAESMMGKSKRGEVALRQFAVVGEPEDGGEPRFLRAGFKTRGCLAMTACASVICTMIEGKTFSEALAITPDDVKALAVPVLAHRIILGGLYGRSTKSEEVVREALSQIAAPVESGEGA